MTTRKDNKTPDKREKTRRLHKTRKHKMRHDSEKKKANLTGCYASPPPSLSSLLLFCLSHNPDFFLSNTYINCISIGYVVVFNFFCLFHVFWSVSFFCICFVSLFGFLFFMSVSRTSNFFLQAVSKKWKDAELEITRLMMELALTDRCVSLLQLFLCTCSSPLSLSSSSSLYVAIYISLSLPVPLLSLSLLLLLFRCLSLSLSLSLSAFSV